MSTYLFIYPLATYILFAYLLMYVYMLPTYLLPTWNLHITNLPIIYLFTCLLYYVLHGTVHDMLFVQHAFMLHGCHLKEQGCSPKYHFVWSNRCSGQFKSTRIWYFVFQYLSLTTSNDFPTGCKRTWNFSAMGHGKWEVDGARVLLKRKV